MKAGPPSNPTKNMAHMLAPNADKQLFCRQEASKRSKRRWCVTTVPGSAGRGLVLLAVAALLCLYVSTTLRRQPNAGESQAPANDRQPLQFGRLHLLDDLADHAKGQIASPTNQPGSRMDSPLASKVSNSSPAAFEAPHEASKHRPATCPPLNEPYEGPARLYPVPSNRTRGPCSCTPVAPFILFSIQRSGSGWVESLLKNHSAIHSHGEQFNNRNLKTGGWKAARAVLEGVFNLELVAEEAECLAAVGLKWMLNQGVFRYQQELLPYVRERGVSVILLLRRNPLRRLVSLRANQYDREAKLVDGEHVSHVYSREEAEKLAGFKPTLDPRTLVAELQEEQRTQGMAIEMLAGTRHVVVYYEDVVSDPGVVERLQAFLGVTPGPVRSLQVPIHTQALQHHVANWEEVKSTLAGTAYEPMLYDQFSLTSTHTL